jgi:hypothetical protein
VGGFGEFLPLSTRYKVVGPDGASVGEADSIDGIVEVVKNAAPGRYVIRRISPDPGTGDSQSWDWGASTKSRKGKITLDLPPWVD